MLPPRRLLPRTLAAITHSPPTITTKGPLLSLARPISPARAPWPSNQTQRLATRPFTQTGAIMSAAADPAPAPEPSPSNTTTDTPTTEPTTTEEQPALPPLTPAEFRGYNRLAEHMDLFHAHFRSQWNMLYGAASSGRRPGGLSLRSFISEGQAFLSQLAMHHHIEETYIFPVLAKRMPEFSASASAGGGNNNNNKKANELLQQHKEIHRGMDALKAYLDRCERRECELRLPELKDLLDTWGAVLWTHLDQEVKALGAENMRKHWSIEEIRRIPM
ncbi:hypothetical protein F4780DRAFT_763989 [Xylariomycetidae sp. FL0641]|nr:hypothetical protein F4780DRAFT_763989 [Xylariomycetidae sp. FL0641]